mgnify:CR=1 FL=1
MSVPPSDNTSESVLSTSSPLAVTNWCVNIMFLSFVLISSFSIKVGLLFTIFSVFSFSNECSGNKCMIENKVVENGNKIVNDLDYNKLKNKYIVYGSIYCHVCVSEFKHMKMILIIKN